MQGLGAATWRSMRKLAAFASQRQYYVVVCTTHRATGISTMTAVCIRTCHRVHDAHVLALVLPVELGAEPAGQPAPEVLLTGGRKQAAASRRIGGR